MTTTDEPDPAAEPADTGTEDTQPATEPDTPEHPDMPGMHWDSDRGVYVDTSPPPAPSREQRYRQALRATESERDTLRQRLDARDTADIERMCLNRLTDPADLWRADVSLDQLRGEDSEIDPALVDEAVAKVVAEHPHWATPPVSPAAPTSAVSFGAEKPNLNGDQQVSWQGVFEQARARE